MAGIRSASAGGGGGFVGGVWSGRWQVAPGEVAYGDHATIASSHVCTQASRGTHLLNVRWLTGGP
jgi:hypothetical protein